MTGLWRDPGFSCSHDGDPNPCPSQRSHDVRMQSLEQHRIEMETRLRQQQDRFAKIREDLAVTSWSCTVCGLSGSGSYADHEIVCGKSTRTHLSLPADDQRELTGGAYVARHVPQAVIVSAFIEGHGFAHVEVHFRVGIDLTSPGGKMDPEKRQALERWVERAVRTIAIDWDMPKEKVSDRVHGAECPVKALDFLGPCPGCGKEKEDE